MCYPESQTAGTLSLGHHVWSRPRADLGLSDNSAVCFRIIMVYTSPVLLKYSACRIPLDRHIADESLRSLFWESTKLTPFMDTQQDRDRRAHKRMRELR